MMHTIIEEAIRKHKHLVQLYPASENDVYHAIRMLQKANMIHLNAIKPCRMLSHKLVYIRHPSPSILSV